MNQNQDEPGFRQPKPDPVQSALSRVQQDRLSDAEKQELWTRIQGSRQRMEQNRKLRRFYRLGAAAAIILLALGTALWIFQQQHTPGGLIETAQGQQHLIDQVREVKLKTSLQTLSFHSDSLIDYQALSLPEKTDPQIAYHTLTVPYGKRSEIILPDGSVVWMNAGSQLTFPAHFDPAFREVYLEGEAYFDVTHDPSRPFTVQTSDMQIRVLGTTFNLSTYREDAVSSVYLLSGSIELSGNAQREFAPQRLTPGQIARLDKSQDRLILGEKSGQPEVLWRRKQLLLDKTPMEDLMRKLERVYNTEIQVRGFALSAETFSGRLDLTQPLGKVLGYIYDLDEVQLIEKERRVVIQKK